jgi:hypothetical protein
VRKSDDKVVCGVYITENDKRVYVGRVQPARAHGAQLEKGRIFWVPSSDIDVVTVGPLQGIKDSEKHAKALAAEIYKDRPQEAAPAVKPETNTETFGPSAKKVTITNTSEEPPKKAKRPSMRPHPRGNPKACATATL